MPGESLAEELRDSDNEYLGHCHINKLSDDDRQHLSFGHIHALIDNDGQSLGVTDGAGHHLRQPPAVRLATSDEGAAAVYRAAAHELVGDGGCARGYRRAAGAVEAPTPPGPSLATSPSTKSSNPC
jgi:hypothetical protein